MKWTENTVYDPPRWELENDHGLMVATVFQARDEPACHWHTWDAQGIGCENDNAPDIGRALTAAMAAVKRQGLDLLEPDVGADEPGVEPLVRCLHLYSGHRVDSRGPLGCILEALEEIAPRMHAELERLGWSEAYSKYIDDDPREDDETPR